MRRFVPAQIERACSAAIVVLRYDLLSMCSSISAIENSPAIGAVVGAATAFFLVMANDFRRDRRRARKILPAILKREAFLVDNRIRSRPDVQRERSRGRLVEHLSPAFSAATIRRYAEELTGHITECQTMCLYNIAVSMETADDLNARAAEAVRRWNEEATKTPTTLAGATNMDNLFVDLQLLYNAELKQLNEIRSLIGAYLTKSLDERGGALQTRTPP